MLTIHTGAAGFISSAVSHHLIANTSHPVFEHEGCGWGRIPVAFRAP